VLVLALSFVLVRVSVLLLMHVACCAGAYPWQGAPTAPGTVPALSIATAIGALGFPKVDVEFTAAALLKNRVTSMELSTVDDGFKRLGLPLGFAGLVGAYLRWVGQVQAVNYIVGPHSHEC
jgi:hypothetical protein